MQMRKESKENKTQPKPKDRMVNPFMQAQNGGEPIPIPFQKNNMNRIGSKSIPISIPKEEVKRFTFEEPHVDMFYSPENKYLFTNANFNATVRPSDKLSFNANAQLPVGFNFNNKFGSIIEPYPVNYSVSGEYKPNYKNSFGVNIGNNSYGVTYKRTLKNGGDISIPDLEEGNWLTKYELGGTKKPKPKKSKPANLYVDLKKEYGLDPFSKEGILKAKELATKNPNFKFVCDANGCSQIAVNAADAFGNDFSRGNAWDLGNLNSVVSTNPVYANLIGKGILPDPTNYSAPSELFQKPGTIIGLNRVNNRVLNPNDINRMASSTEFANDSYDYANQKLYPGSRGYEHVGYLIDENTLLHGTGKDKTHPAYYVINQNLKNGINLAGYGKYQPVEAIEPSGYLQKAYNYFFKEDGGPIVTPYSQDYTNKEYDKYNKFYEDYNRVPYLRKDDKFDAYYQEKRKDIPSTPEYHTGWVKEFSTGDKMYTTKQPKSSPNYNVRQVENEITGYSQDPSKLAEASRMVKSFTNYKPTNQFLGFKQGGQLQQFAPGGFLTTPTTTKFDWSTVQRLATKEEVEVQEQKTKKPTARKQIINKPAKTTSTTTQYNITNNVPEWTTSTEFSTSNQIPINVNYEDVNRRGDIAYENRVNPYQIKLRTEGANYVNRANALNKAGSISMPSAQPSWLNRTLDVLSHPTEAFGYVVQGRDLPTRMSGRNPFDNVFGFPGQVLKSGKNLIGAALNPIDTGIALGAGATNLFTNLTTGENLFDKSYNDKALGLGLDFLNVAGSGIPVKTAFNRTGRVIDKAIYPTRTYRVEAPGGNVLGYESSDLANKVFNKGDWSTRDLRELVDYTRSRGLLEGKNLNITEYKVPFWKKNIKFDKDVAALKKSQGESLNPNEYIIPKNRFLYPRRTTTINAVPEHLKLEKTLLPSGQSVSLFRQNSRPAIGSGLSEQLASAPYRYIEDQINAITGHRMPLTYDLSNKITGGYDWKSPISLWKQPAIAPNKGFGRFSGLNFKKYGGQKNNWLNKYK
jgi:hypothetical protein